MDLIPLWYDDICSTVLIPLLDLKVKVMLKFYIKDFRISLFPNLGWILFVFGLVQTFTQYHPSTLTYLSSISRTLSCSHLSPKNHKSQKFVILDLNEYAKCFRKKMHNLKRAVLSSDRSYTPALKNLEFYLPRLKPSTLC